jgi:hypothetical protein
MQTDIVHRGNHAVHMATQIGLFPQENSLASSSGGSSGSEASLT